MERRRIVGTPHRLLCAFVILHSSFVIAAEPSRQELWVPTPQLDTVLEAHPNAVMLDAAQYEALIRDAGKIKPVDDPKSAPPKIIAIEGLTLTGKVEPGAANVSLQSELTLHLPAKEWLSTKIAWPFEMGSVTSAGSVLAYVEKDAKTRELIVFAKGPGRAKLRFEAVVPVHLRLRAGEHTLELPDVPFGGVLNLQLPTGVRLLAGSAHERSGDTLQVAFDHRSYDDNESSLKPGVPRAFRVRWIESPPTVSPQPARFSETATADVYVTESNVATMLRFGVRVQDNAEREVEIEWALSGKDTQVTDVSGVAVRRWRQDGAKLLVTVERDGGMQDLTVNLRRMINSIDEASELPLLVLNPPLRTQAKLYLVADLDFLDLAGAKQLTRDTFEFQLGVDQPRLVLRTSKPRIESDVDVIARIDKDSVQIERKLAIRSDRPVTEVKVTLPPGEEFIAILSMPVGSNIPVSISNSTSLNTNQRLITPNTISQPIFSERLITSNVISQPTASPFRLTWRRVGQTIAILPTAPISPANPLELSVTSRLKLTKAWTGPKNPETITVQQLDIPDAVKVAGYTALDFDDAWRVALKEAKGLEDRDARLTPVQGRMAWFGLREHALTFEVERAEAVFSTEVTAYALPRARTIEIEGQFALDISGAPLRSFQVKLPVKVANLLRVTSPLVGEQQLDETTGVWTFTLRQESKGRQNVRWRLSLPAASTDPTKADEGVRAPIQATLPHIELPQTRRFAGTWIIEANTDTQISTTMQNMQPLDVLRVPVVADYQPRHRITSAFTYGAGENALAITAQRHAHSELAALVVNRMLLVSVLGTDGHSLHEATLDLSHSGEQFVSLHLPPGAELLSTSSDGQAVKPVRGVEDAIAIPLPAGSANAPHTEVRVQYRQHHAPWDTSGTQNLEPVRIVGNVPVLSTDWRVHAPATFGYGKVDTTLEQEGEREIEPLRNPLSVLWDAISPGYTYAMHTSQSVSAMADREIARRMATVEDARAAMDRGDKLFRESDYDGALGFYHAVVDALPNAPMTEDWLNLAKLKQADCSVVVARERAKQSRHDEARQLLQEALQLVPGHQGATTFMQQLNDPDRWPAALTAHVENVAKVQRGLLLANSSVELGNYDNAISQYQAVLRVDPYSIAARRGMENAEKRRLEYFKSAADHQRAKMLAQVDEAWEDKVPVLGAAVTFDYGPGRTPGAYLTEKMNKIILPEVHLENATIEQSLDYLRTKMREADHAGEGSFSIVLRTGDSPLNASISLDLKDVPMSEALRYVTELAQMKYKVEAHAVLIVPLSEDASQLYTRSYRVPMDFLNTGVASGIMSSAPADPFAAGGERPKTAKQLLEAGGITFPEGASANYSAPTTQMVVRNTQPNLDLVEAMVEAINKGPAEDGDSRQLFESVDEMRFKSGLIPLDVVLPETGRLLRFHGAQPPEVLALSYTSWSQQMVRAVLAVALGLALFWRWGRRRPWLLSLLVVVLAVWGVPLLVTGTLLALANAVAFGWLCGLGMQVLWRLFAFIRPGEAESGEPRAESLMSWARSLRSFVIRHSAFVILCALCPSLFAQAPPADPAAHTVIIPYDAKLPLNAQKAERFYLGYEEFQRLWKTAKENRKALPTETDATQQAVIHSALYQGRIEERGLVLEARITATTRGEWSKLLLPFAQMVNGKDTTKALVGAVRVDGKAAALSGGLLTLEHAGTHAIELTVTLPLARDWNDLTLRLPPSLSGMLTLHTPKSDGWLRVNEVAASTVEEQADGRLFTQTLGTHREVRLQRSARGLERGEGPVPAASVRATLTLRELEPESLDAEVVYEFPGAVRRTLEFAVDAPEGGGGLEIGALNVYTTIPGAGEVRVPTMTTQTRREGGKLIFTLTLRHEVSHGASMRIMQSQRYLVGAGVRTLPLIQPVAQRVRQDVAVLHDESMKVQVSGGTAQRSTNSAGDGLSDAGRWQWSGGTAPTYEVQPAALLAEADVSYVFQLTEQKAELLAALTLKRKRGVWTRAVVGLPVDYEVQAVQGPTLTAWQHEGAQLYLQLNPNIAGMEARVVVHLARVVPQAVTTWTLEPLKLENYEKVGGKALIVAHAANEVKLLDLTQRTELKELDATVLDSVFAIAPPMEKKRALQHEGAAWKDDVALTRQASRFAADAVLLVLASDAGIRVSQQVVAVVEQGAVRQISVRLPAALPEAVVSGPLLRETRSRIDGAERVYECSLQTEVLDRAELTFDLDLPLTAELEVPFVKVAAASRLTRWFVLDNASAREAKIATQTALETVSREAVPYLPQGLARPQFFRATGDGALKLAYQQLTSTEGNAALVTLADLTTVLRADGERWDIAQYSLINRSLQFLPVMLPDGAELVSVSVSGEPVRADEETQDGKRVRLIPLIHTRPGQRALEVKMIYRFAKAPGRAEARTTNRLDDPELVGLSVERTTWTVWTPKGWKLKDFDGNMTETVAEGRELLQLEGMLSELGEVNRALASGKLAYGDAEEAYRAANDLNQKVQSKKRVLESKVGRGTLTLNEPRLEQGTLDREIQQQGQLLKGNWDSNYTGKNAEAKGGKDSGVLAQGNTSWGFNGEAQQQELRLQGSNTFSGAVTVNGGQLFNDNVAVDNRYFANGLQVQQQAVLNGGSTTTSGPISSGLRSGGLAITNNSIDNLLSTGATGSSHALNTSQGAQLTQNASGSVNVVNSNARSNNLGQTQAANAGGFATAGERRAAGGENRPQVSASLAPADFLDAPRSPAAGQPGGMNDGQEVTLGFATAPAMSADPFGAPAAAMPPPPPAPRKPMEQSVKADLAKDSDDDVIRAQTVAALRPTGRRALEIALPLDGTAHHFSKLKDHAVLSVEIGRLGDSQTTARLLVLSGGLLLWIGVWWWTAKRRLRMT